MRFLDPLPIEEVKVIQQGQVIKLKTRGAGGQPQWAYRYRVEGRGSARPQVGGFASRAEAQEALRKALDRIGPAGAATITLGELVDEYLAVEPAPLVALRGMLDSRGPLFFRTPCAAEVIAARRVRELSTALRRLERADHGGDPGLRSRSGRLLSVSATTAGSVFDSNFRGSGIAW